MSKKMRCAILGSGNIGSDLLVKMMRSSYLECTLFIGRRPDSKGLQRASKMSIPITTDGINAIIKNPNCCDIVFDCTSALDHAYHWSILNKMDKFVIDMTPSMIGQKIIPALGLDKVSLKKNVNMVSCGGQASIPMCYAISQIEKNIEYIEVVSSIASLSAGPGTRRNIDEYIENTESGIRELTGCKNVKTILILNPAIPCIDMQVTISIKVVAPNMSNVNGVVKNMENKLKTYVPGYQVVVPPVYESNRIFMTVRVKGLGDYLPSYAGNLDIINCAALATAEAYAKQIT